MIDPNGLEWGIRVTRRNRTTGQTRTEDHRHYSEAAARTALLDTLRRIAAGRGQQATAPIVAAELINRPVGEWQAVKDE